MFFEVELLRYVSILAENVDRRNGAVLQRSILTHLLKNLLSEKASKEHGYFLGVTRVKSIGRGDEVDESSNVLFPVVFNCRTFRPFRGEILQGVVYFMNVRGVFLRCGPISLAYLPALKMPTYNFIPGENPAFVNNDHARIEHNVVVQFIVLDMRWVEKWGNWKHEIKIFASLVGDSLGPISLAGSDDFDM